MFYLRMLISYGGSDIGQGLRSRRHAYALQHCVWAQTITASACWNWLVVVTYDTLLATDWSANSSTRTTVSYYSHPTGLL